MGEQFATPEAIEMLRSNAQNDGPTDLITLSACDPLNMIGILTLMIKSLLLLETRSVSETG
ncbi:MAG: hypothetical protein CM1200mP35_01850 [Chloroflexota bacterium]|nr:MAG: hypothetical protein CM1200mP35_01850 [Chloroflexota bacterium]